MSAELIEILDKGAIEWNNWRKTNPVKPNFEGATLKNRKFEKYDFQSSTFRKADLEGTNFRKADLQN